MYGLSVVTTYVTITFVGGLPFLLVAVILIFLYYSSKSLQRTSARCDSHHLLVGKIYGQTSRDMRRLGMLFPLRLGRPCH